MTSCICIRNAAVAVDGASNGVLMTGLVMRLVVVEEWAKCDNQANVEQNEVFFSSLLHCVMWSWATVGHWPGRPGLQRYPEDSKRPEQKETGGNKNDHCQSRTGTLLLITTGRSSSQIVSK